MLNFLSTIVLLLSTITWVIAQQPQSTDLGIPAPVSTTGFNPNDGEPVNQQEQSWIQRDHHYVIIIVVALVVVGLVLYYIVRSVRGMRRRLARENEQQLQMLNQVRPQQNQSYVPVVETVMMEGYKHDQFQQQQQQQQQHHHRY